MAIHSDRADLIDELFCRQSLFIECTCDHLLETSAMLPILNGSLPDFNIYLVQMLGGED
jgi:hypothetical protein